MADTKISAAPDAGTLLANDMLPIARSGNSSAFRASIGSIATYTNASIPAASSTLPSMDGTATIGVGTTWARADHIHPTDTSRYAASNPSGYQTASDVTTALASYAPLAAPVFTGDARAVTPTYGDNDTSIATTAFVQAAMAPTANNVGRNLLHNPMFNVAQRGAGPWTANWSYTLDRWYMNFVTDTQSINQFPMTDADRTAVGDEAAKYAIRNTFTGNAAAGAFNLVSQAIEDVRRLAGKSVTVSFWACCLSGTLKLGISLDQSFGGGGSPSAQVNGNGQAVTLSTSWQRFSATLSVPSIVGKTVGTAGSDCTLLNLWCSSGATNASRAGSIGVQSGSIFVYGIQLEIGTQATPLDYSGSPADQLQQCQRFYQLGSIINGAYAPSGTAVWASQGPLVTMRAVPTSTILSNTSAGLTGLTITSDTQKTFLGATTSATGGYVFNVGYSLSADL